VAFAGHASLAVKAVDEADCPVIRVRIPAWRAVSWMRGEHAVR
jgi:hypothetical protein